MPSIIWSGGTYQFWDQADGVGGPNKAFANDGSRIERPVLLTPATWTNAVRAFLGFPSLGTIRGIGPGGGSTGRYVIRSLPHGYEDEDHFGTDGRPWLYALSIQRSDALCVAATSAVSGAPRAVLDRATVLYAPRTYKVRADNDPLGAFAPQPGQDAPLAGAGFDEATLKRFVSKRPQPLSRVITLPRALPRWQLESGDKGFTASPETPGPPVFEGIPFPESGQEIEYTWHEIPSLGDPPNPCVDLYQASKAIGRVNQFLFDEFPAGTLLCLTPRMVPVVSVIGDIIWNIHYRFRFMPKTDLSGVDKGHNALLRFVPRASGPPLLDYRYVTTDGTSAGSRMLRTFDFAKLFRPVQG